MFVIETIIENSLYAIKYDDSEVDEFENNEFEEDYEKPNEFRRLFNNWSDPEYLDAFFYEHRADLQKEFYNFISIEEAINQTIEESLELESKLKEIAEKGKENNFENLQTLFKPLNKKEEGLVRIPEYQKSKVYGDCHKSWLRIYAIRIEKNVFIITGGAIKLTENMNERDHLLNELDKMRRIKQFLIDVEIIDNESIIEFIEF
jgi:hypothetical protein